MCTVHSIHFCKGPVCGEPGGRVELLHLPGLQYEHLVHVQRPVHLQKEAEVFIASFYFHVAHTLSMVYVGLARKRQYQNYGTLSVSPYVYLRVQSGKIFSSVPYDSC